MSVREAQTAHRPEPGVLCWNCRKLTPYDEERCQACGAAFGGSTGGEYAVSRIGTRPRTRSTPVASEPPRQSPAETDRSRSLSDLLRDLGRVHDVSSKLAILRADEPTHATLFQCPSCGRFVGAEATECACGVRFSESAGSFPCPECESRVPILDDECPVCGAAFVEDAPELSYSCPKCGTPVSADALRCICGVWFED